MLYFPKYSRNVVFHWRVGLYAFLFEIKIEHAVSLKTGNVKNTVGFSASFMSKTQLLDIPLLLHSPKLTLAGDLQAQFTSQLRLISHQWGNIKGKLISHLTFTLSVPFIGSKLLFSRFRDRWFVLAWLRLLTYAFIYCFRIFVHLWRQVPLERWIEDSWHLSFKNINLCKWS